LGPWGGEAAGDRREHGGVARLKLAVEDLGLLVDELMSLARRSGLDAVGITGAEPFGSTRQHLEERKAAGLHGGMHFTYGDPARATDPGRAVPGARALVVGARSYRRAPPAGPSSAGVFGQVARYSWSDHYAPLRDGLSVVAGRLEAGGWRARVIVDDNAMVDREAAHRAGLGWYGKNTVLLLPGRGSWFVLGSVVTDAPLPPTTATGAGSCGSCARCLAACPTGALVEPGVLDARRCLAWLLQAPGTFPIELRPALGGRIYGCDDCQEVCPPNRTEDRRHPPPPAGDEDEPWVELVWLLGCTDAELLAHLGRWYIPRRQPRYLRRNALVALGNVGDGGDRRVARALGDGLAHGDPLVRAHAVWAAARLGRRDLVVGLAASETEPEVRTELTAAGLAG
jgi:epoxyqueuosine reductase